MLFHVTAVHDAAHCPGWHSELRQGLIEGWSRMAELAERHNVRLEGAYTTAPEHAEIFVVEAQRPAAIAFLLTELYPFELAEITVTPVERIEDMAAYAREVMG